MKRPQNASPCATCPFLACNFGKPNPLGVDLVSYDDRPGDEPTQWYSEKNLRRIWDGTRHKGLILTCHSTDKQAVAVGKQDRGDDFRLCVGHLILAFLHLKKYEELHLANPEKPMKVIFREYKKVSGDRPLFQNGLISIVFIFAFEGGGMCGTGPPLPSSFHAATLTKLSVPWNDGILDAANSSKRR